MQQLPLDGIRILEFGGYIAAPYATSILTALGAEVVKIERPVVGEDFRRGMNDKSLYFMQYNAGKRSLAVDLKRPEGIGFVKGLVPQFDVVVENLRPGKMAALGLGHDDLVALRPDLVYVSVTGFGDRGELAQRPAYDMIGQAFGGIISVLSDAGDMKLTGTCLADLVTGLSTATGILAALVGHGRTGTGTRLQTSIVEAVSTITVDAMTQYYDAGRVDPSRESRHPQAVNFCLRTADGQFIALHLSSSQKFFGALVDAIERPDLKTDPRFAEYPERVANYFELAAVVADAFLTRPAHEWEKLLIRSDVPFSHVNTLSDLREHPQVVDLKLYEPERDGVSLVRPPWRFDGERPARSKPAPRVGQDTLSLAAEICDAEQVAALVEAGVLYAGD